jgi:F-type H+-transporting ATPase subunit delta
MSVARSYARALFEAARDTKASAQDMEQIEKQLESFELMIKQSPSLKVALMAPATSSKDKAALVEEIAKKSQMGKILSSFLSTMARKERMELFSEIREAFSTVRLEAEGGILGTLVSADPLEAADVESISKAFQRKLGKRVAFSASTDPALLAGMKVTVNGVTYDGTLRSQLQRLRDRLMAGTGIAH